jgi:hypothetical protein
VCPPPLPSEALDHLVVSLHRPADCSPAGARLPRIVTAGYFTIDGNATTKSAQSICPTGSYCENGVAYLCPEGSFGSQTALNTPACSGQCSAGYYCPAGSTSATAFDCGGANVYCPVGSALPLDVPAGEAAFVVVQHSAHNIRHTAYSTQIHRTHGPVEEVTHACASCDYQAGSVAAGVTQHTPQQRYPVHRAASA